MRGAVGGDLEALLRRVPAGTEGKWVSVLAVSLDGMHGGPALTPEQLRDALSDYLANPEREPNVARLRGYLRRAAADHRPPPPGGAIGGAGANPGGDATDWAAVEAAALKIPATAAANGAARGHSHPETRRGAA